MQATDPYDVLGVAPDATQAEISSAFRRLVRRHHPDLRNAQAHEGIREGGSETDLERVLHAYTVLRDPDRRARYDRLRRPAPATAQHPVTTAASTGRTETSSHSQPPIKAGPIVWQPLPEQAGEWLP